MQNFGGKISLRTFTWKKKKVMELEFNRGSL
jgi:hypothetical protein